MHILNIRSTYSNSELCSKKSNHNFYITVIHIGKYTVLYLQGSLILFCHEFHSNKHIIYKDIITMTTVHRINNCSIDVESHE